MEAQKAETRGLSDPARRGKWESKSREERGPSVLWIGCINVGIYTFQTMVSTTRGRMNERVGIEYSMFVNVLDCYFNIWCLMYIML